MDRRRFIQSTAGSFLLPLAASPGIAAIAEVAATQGCIFYDERFEAAHRLAKAWSNSIRPIAVHADVTPAWAGILEPAIRTEPLRVRGVTAQSFLFCLRILMAEHAEVAAHSERLDRDLFVWRIDTMPRQLSTESRHD